MKKPLLVPNAKTVAVRASSQLLVYVAGLVETLALAWPGIEKHVGMTVEPATFHYISIGVLVAAAIARLIQQESLR